MNAEQLNAIKERAEKATPGPWDFHKGDKLRGDRRSAVIEHFDCDFGEWFIHGDLADISDAEFIAHTREDIPALVAEVERLQNRCELYEVARRNDGKMIEYKDAEIKRLRAELTDIIEVATEEASCIPHDNGYGDIIAIARSALK